MDHADRSLRNRVLAKAKSCAAKSDPCDFDAVRDAELEEIEERRTKIKGYDLTTTRSTLVGLALSGGGVRSATFSLGLLQEMREQGLLSKFDYLSTVSGGGFTGGFWSASLSRDKAPEPNLLPRERIEPDRWREYVDCVTPPAAKARSSLRADSESCPEGSLSAKHGDAIHHLRMFSNYLTPRRGLLSADSWKAATVFLRNLFLTWTVLVPVVVGLVLVGQLYFAVPQLGAGPFFGEWGSQHLIDHFHAALQPILVLLAWISSLSLLWMLNSTGPWIPSLLGLCSVAWTVSFLASGFRLEPAPWIQTWTRAAIVAGSPLVCVFAFFRWGKPGRAIHPYEARALRRNQIVRLQALLSVVGVALAVLLAISGFSHHLAGYVLDPQTNMFAKGSILSTALVSLGSGIYTALKGTPSAVADVETKQRPSLLSRIVFAIAPALMLLLLASVAAASTHWVISRAGQELCSQALGTATLGGVVFLMFLAAHETFNDEMELQRWRRILIGGAPIVVGLIAWCWPPSFCPIRHRLAHAALFVAAVALLCRLCHVVFARHFDAKQNPNKHLKARVGALFATIALLGAGAVAYAAPAATTTSTQSARAIASIALSCAWFAAAEFAYLESPRWRAVVLVGIAYIGLVSIFVVAPNLGADVAQLERPAHWKITLDFIVIACTVVVGVGWTADPNQLSIHAFYAARLVRAYLGASNNCRQSQEITDSVEGDDLCLASLQNCARGGPYHLINTTLNLVGGRDLGTSQRCADLFVMSKLYCGSSRTGYRKTHEYMQGSLSLGTAIAASGAAFSPNMGSKSPSAALAMLLAFCNVRLGYWAPTPNRCTWRSPQPRLWPLYLLRECLCQTNALYTYCYLTDGGHFDNTGLYALVARGCRVIVVADCGADPDWHFEDIATAVRLCRTDFGAEIDLKLGSFTPKQGERETAAHVVHGTIQYSKSHAERLGWAAGDAQSRSGVIIWIKPALTGHEPADVRGYGFEHPTFPQETTLDQWYDEAQFESYRRLGLESARVAFGKGELANAVAALRPTAQPGRNGL